MKPLILGLFLGWTGLGFGGPLQNMHAIVAKKRTAAGATLKDSNTAASNGSQTFGGAAGTKYIAGRFTSGATGYTLTRVDVYLAKVGTPSFNISASIYTNNADSPGTLVGTGSTNSIATGDLTASEALYSFTGLSAGLSATTDYYIVLTCNSVGDISNRGLWYHNSSAANQTDTSSDATTWNTNSSSRQIKYATYGN